MCLYLKNHSVNVSGIITGFSERGMSIIVPDYDIEKVKIYIYYYLSYI